MEVRLRCKITHHKNLKTSHLLTNSQVGLLTLGKDPSLGAHPHKLEGFGLADSSDSKDNFLDSQDRKILKKKNEGTKDQVI